MRCIGCFLVLVILLPACCLAGGIKPPDAAGQFYPADPAELSAMIDRFLARAQPPAQGGRIAAVVVPHAGYPFSGQTAAYAYKLLSGKNYTTVVLMASSHRGSFPGIAVYDQGAFRTPLGQIPVDEQFASRLLAGKAQVVSNSAVFFQEHPIEVQLPFIQKVLPQARIVPLIFGIVDYPAIEQFASVLAEAIGARRDVLLIASSDMYHGYDFHQAEAMDQAALEYLRAMDPDALFQALESKKARLCGGAGVVAAMLAAGKQGQAKLTILDYTNSARVTGKAKVGEWTVGYSSSAIVTSATKAADTGGSIMLNKTQQKRLLEIARGSIETYLKTGKKMSVQEKDPLLGQVMGAFVTLHEHGQLRGCIGNMIGSQPLYLTVRDMAVEAATGDPRFVPVKPDELKNIEIEISALSPLEKVDSADAIELGKHGVLVKRGFNSGVFLPQVATETGWNKEQFLSYLCSQKAGLAPDAWKDPVTQLYVFTAHVFSEKDVK